MTNWKTKDKPLSKKKKEILREVINRKNLFCFNCYNCYNCFNCYNCSNCSYCYNCFDCSYMIRNVQFTKEEYLKFKRGEYKEEDLE